ncbi:MAG: class I SAM-dependent methyltransferase [Steroidobacteraceae bacterium]
MRELTASRTALATALMRALHTRLDLEPLIDDPWGERLVPASVREQFRDESLLHSPAYANVILRTRYAEDALQAAITRGIRQYVILGAGFDSFAVRRPAYASEVQIFEIDHPATQTMKTRRLEECGITLADCVHFIAADLAACSVAEALARSPYRKDLPAFFSWLGVTMYLTREANFAALRSIAACAMPGSELAFTYMDEKLFTLNPPAFRELKEKVASLGEPYQSGFDPATIAGDLRDCGLALVEDLEGEQVAARYGRAGQNRAASSQFSHVALARSGREITTF